MEYKRHSIYYRPVTAMKSTRHIDNDNHSNSAPYCIHAFISGLVQGVWFRAFTREQALAHQVKGWAKNLADGRVEVMLAGEKNQVEAVLTALQTGPPLSKVSGIEQKTVAWCVFDSFSIA